MWWHWQKNIDQELAWESGHKVPLLPRTPTWSLQPILAGWSSQVQKTFAVFFFICPRQFGDLLLNWICHESASLGSYDARCKQKQVVFFSPAARALKRQILSNPPSPSFPSKILKSLPVNSLPLQSLPFVSKSFWLLLVKKVWLTESINNTFNCWPPSLVVLAWCI